MDWNKKAEKYDEHRADAEKLYKSFGKIRCPAVGNEFVHFTSEGFNHLVYRIGKKKPRDKKVQIMKFELLEKAKFIIETSTTFQEYEESYTYKKVNRRGKWIDENVLVRSWGLIAIVRKFRVKVVIKQEGNGKKEFYSVIPAWFKRQYRDIKLVDTSTGSGLLADDE